MKIKYKVYGQIMKKWFEINLDFSRWLIGFGWYNGRIKTIHINFGPLAVLYSWRKKYNLYE